ncbi:hypothetical protein G8S55_11585 [Clostridium botulinum C]|uniref:hypothetical protein n=1 Tax=Clostridium botulinum TaxID=1491 RepID=UPI001E606E40|nr:hypothetical protein [Clostridium botulinum]MCD3217859.1 hypothetical protein [Clostridium botulinum C]
MEIIRIVNPKQAGAYVADGVNPIKIYWNKNKWVWEFNKTETKNIWKRWRSGRISKIC